jgi:hypothetical protein
MDLRVPDLFDVSRDLGVAGMGEMMSESGVEVGDSAKEAFRRVLTASDGSEKGKESSGDPAARPRPPATHQTHPK